MPTYPYKCDTCGHMQKEERAMADRDKAPPCERCGGTTTRQLTAVPFRVRRTHISEL